MLTSQPSRHEVCSSRDFVIDDWNVHVIKGPNELQHDLRYVLFTGDFGFRHGYPLPSPEVVEEFIRRERSLLSRFDVNIVNLEFMLPCRGVRDFQ